MVTSPRLYKILPLLFFIGVGSAQAAEDLPPLHFFGRYDFDWEGIYIGSLVLGIEETANTYNMRVKVNSGGVVNLFTKHTDDTQVVGRRIESLYLPINYESHYKTKNKPRHIELIFNKNSVITKELVEPPEDRHDRPEVPHSLKDGSYDPLSLLMAIRSDVKECHAFDAKTLFEVQSAPSTPRTLRIESATRIAISYSLTRTPLAGLTAKEKKEFDKGEPALLLYFSDDEKRIPLMARVSLFIGRIQGLLVKECTTWDACTI